VALLPASVAPFTAPWAAPEAAPTTTDFKTFFTFVRMPVEEPLRPAFFAVRFFAAPFFVAALRAAGDFLTDFLVAFLVAFLAVFLAADFFAAFFPVDLLVFFVATTNSFFWGEVYIKQRFPRVEKRCFLWTMLQRCCQSPIRTGSQ
jgi:hypothetical protein